MNAADLAVVVVVDDCDSEVAGRLAAGDVLSTGTGRGRADYITRSGAGVGGRCCVGQRSSSISGTG